METTSPEPAPQSRQHKIQVLKSVLLFYGVACGFAWVVWLPMVLGPTGLKLHHHDISLPVSACIGTLGPFIACFISYHRLTGSWRAVRLLPRNRRESFWLLLGPLLILLCFFFLFPALITSGGPRQWHWKVTALAGLWVQMFNDNLLGGPLFEEFGWRGFLQTRLQEVLPPWIAALVVAILWSAWHLPLFIVGWSSASPFLFLLILSGLSVVMASAFNASGSSVLVAILMHSAFNASSGFIPAFLGDTPTRNHPAPELLLATAFLLVAVAALAITRGELFAQSPSNPPSTQPSIRAS